MVGMNELVPKRPGLGSETALVLDVTQDKEAGNNENVKPFGKFRKAHEYSKRAPNGKFRRRGHPASRPVLPFFTYMWLT